MIADVPALIPVTTPDEEPIVAIAGALLVHVPPEIWSDKVVVVPTHVLVLPIMVCVVLTVTMAVATQEPPGM